MIVQSDGRITVCETSDDNFWNDWQGLIRKSGDIVLLPELPAYPWFAKYPMFNRRIWNDALRDHNKLITKLEYEYIYVYEGEKPEIRDATHIVIMGGPMGVYEEDEYPFLAQEKETIR